MTWISNIRFRFDSRTHVHVFPAVAGDELLRPRKQFFFLLECLCPSQVVLLPLIIFKLIFLACLKPTNRVDLCPKVMTLASANTGLSLRCESKLASCGEKIQRDLRYEDRAVIDYNHEPNRKILRSMWSDGNEEKESIESASDQS